MIVFKNGRKLIVKFFCLYIYKKHVHVAASLPQKRVHSNFKKIHQKIFSYSVFVHFKTEKWQSIHLTFDKDFRRASSNRCAKGSSHLDGFRQLQILTARSTIFLLEIYHAGSIG